MLSIEELNKYSLGQIKLCIAVKDNYIISRNLNEEEKKSERENYGVPVGQNIYREKGTLYIYIYIIYSKHQRNISDLKQPKFTYISKEFTSSIYRK